MAEANQSKTSSKTEKVTLLKTVQIEPGKPALSPGEHSIPADVVAELKKEGLAK